MIEQALQTAHFNKSKAAKSPRSDSQAAVHPHAEVRLRAGVTAVISVLNLAMPR